MQPVDIAGTGFRVTADEVRLGNRALPLERITAIRYGVYLHRTGIGNSQSNTSLQDAQSYAVWLTDGRDTIKIECARGFLHKTADFESRFRAVVEALWEPVTARITSQLLQVLQGGAGFTIAGGRLGWLESDPTVVFDASGMTQTRPRSKHLPWRMLAGHGIVNGRLILSSAGPADSTFRERLNGKLGWASFSLRDTWNAVCLDPILTSLRVGQDSRATTGGAPPSQGR